MSIPTRRRAGCCRCRSPRPAATRISTPSTPSTSIRTRATARPACRRRFDTLMAGNGDEPDSVYGLIARAVRVIRRQARLSLPAAPGGAVRRRLEADRRRRRLLARHAQGEGPSDLSRSCCSEVESVDGRERRRRRRAFRQGAQPRRASHRRGHADLLGRLVEGARLRRRDARGAARLRPLQGQDLRAGPLHRIRAATPTIGARTCRSTSGQNNFDRLRFEYYRERQVAFEAFKAGAINFHQEYTSRIWATGYDFPAVKDGRVKKEALHNGAPTALAGLVLQHAARSRSRTRACARRSASASISNGRTRT